ncbi:hypothetical protein [Flavobacterium branchiophilum]|uniref:Secreted protein n=1 Tax=Flavobacterium branchiophilum TaxID=55197 RepID=A0A543G4E4_9FLAO|nr:hypothetical protein [Flavobacterium branchiophilum]TQM40917.1 hypothetical protein BC670_1837 [Flavobacterium branchiophilum]
MKSILKLAFLFMIGISTETYAQNQACEDKWNQVTRVNSSDTWKETNTISNGKVYWKSIEYNGEYVHKLYKVASTGLFYVQTYKFDNMVYYSNEKDAIRALFIWFKCGGYFTEQGKVKQ